MESDTNSQIIQLVQSRPVLYSKCNDFRERIELWKEVAEILKADVTWVKSRWHLLRTKFIMEYSSELKGTRTCFKYFNDMSFLVNHINTNAFDMHTKHTNDLRTEPEFVISKKDLEDGSDDDSCNVFMELELDEAANKEMIQMPQTFDLTTEISGDELDEALYMTNDEFSQHQQMAKTPKYKIGSELETFHIVEVTEKEDTATVVLKENPKNKTDESDATKTNSVELEKSCSVQQQEQELSMEVPTKPVPVDSIEANKFYSVKSEKDRCEDTIFGELVTATLRKMESEKKKNVKREIMNILFT